MAQESSNLSNDNEPSPSKLSFSEFLESVPPGRVVLVKELTNKVFANGNQQVDSSDIYIFCAICEGERYFSLGKDHSVSSTSETYDFFSYRCRNCQAQRKIYALWFRWNTIISVWNVKKYGEYPEFGPPTPARVITLVGADRNDFLKGRRCENQGLGVAAFTYYRRVVERSKEKIFDEIIRVTKTVDPSMVDLIADLNAAKKETQFTKAVDAVKHGLPKMLLINGSNPLTLLHSALSEGVHALTDEECLDLAHSIRLVLFEFVERLAQAIRDDRELIEAVNKLAHRARRS